MEQFELEHIKEQTEYCLDDLLEELKDKWDDDEYFFDEDEARNFYNFITRLELDKGTKGQMINPLRFQFEITSEILCVKHRKTKLRRHREALLDISRKNGKGSLVSWIGVYLYFTDNTFGAEYIIVANDVKQATNLYNTMELMIRNNKTLSKHVKITPSSRLMYRKATNSYLRVLSNDGGGLDSYAGYVVILDEVHEYKNDDAYTKLRTGMGLWDEPLMFMTTTASNGQDNNNLEKKFYDYAKDIQSGKFEDDKFYSAIFEADKDCDLLDKTQWYKANPALSIFRQYNDLEDFMLKANRMKSFEAQARRLYLNQHVSIAGEMAINMNLWKTCVKDVGLEETFGRQCYTALDMSSSQDITAFVQVFYDEDTKTYTIYPHLFTPKDTLFERSERDGIRYDLYVEQGYMTALDGNYINFEQLYHYIKEIAGNTDVLEVGYDSWGAIGIASALEKDFTIVPIQQGVKTMSPVIQDFENLLIDEKLIIANNPLLTWMASNVVAREDSNGNVRYDKSKSKYKIDGIIAMLMALSRAIANVNDRPFDASEFANEDFLDKMWS